jgi:hypothetical protein
MFEKTPESPFDRMCNMVFKAYNKYAKELGYKKVLKLTPLRKRAMTPLMSYSKWDLRIVIRELRKSAPFLSRQEWFHFDWLIKEDNFIKVMEGRYSTVHKIDRAKIESVVSFTNKEY